jgi:hypothetical protein
MRYAVLAYNETPPYVDTLTSPDAMPYGNMFLNGIAYYLYLGKLQSEARQDVQYTAGNLTVDLYQRRMDHLKNFVKLFKEEFDRMKAERKTAINVVGFYGSF